jgi:NADH dehydrogenase/NADH:ubiquinone oxidoreductase subunit G
MMLHHLLNKLFKNKRFEVFTAVTMKNAVFWDVALCRSCVNRRFGGTYLIHLQAIKNPRARNQREQVAADCSMKMKAIRSSETSIHTRSTQLHIPEDGILL